MRRILFQVGGIKIHGYTAMVYLAVVSGAMGGPMGLLFVVLIR
jgi:hypothetical protein